MGLTQMRMHSRSSSLNTSKKGLLLTQSNKGRLTPMLLSVLILLPNLQEKKSLRGKDTCEASCRSPNEETVLNRRKMLTEGSWKKRMMNDVLLMYTYLIEHSGGTITE